MNSKELIGLFFLVLITACLSFLITREMYYFPTKAIHLTDDSNNERQKVIEPETVDEKSLYPNENIHWTGKTWIDQESWDDYKNRKLILNLDSNPSGLKDEPVKTYEIPILQDLDRVSKPSISYNEKFACINIGASGYNAYYIFTLPDGKKIDQGKQYSDCVTWINDHEVIIAEHLYGTFDYTYYVLDANTKTKRELSTINLKEEVLSQ